MESAIQKASVLIEAMGWIRQLRDKITVIKVGGSVMENGVQEDGANLRNLLLDIVFMETVGMRPVVVHGGGSAINIAMQERGLEPKFLQGRRVTDDETLAIVEQVLAYETNERIAAEIEELGGRAMPLNFRTTNVLFGRRLELQDQAGKPLDLGHVGTVTRVDRATIENFCYADIVPVIPSMCLSESDSGGRGEKLNVNADTAAKAVAEALGAEKLIFLSDVSGVMTDPNDADSRISSLDARLARQLISNGTISQGMIPKVEACLETLDHGVQKVHIIDGRLRHSLLLEIYTDRGVGTEIVKEST
ncbi:MAG: acetylglutamate kinase [Pirellulales bacterium]